MKLPVSVLLYCERCGAPICGHVFKRTIWTREPDVLPVPPHTCETQSGSEKKGRA